MPYLVCTIDHLSYAGAVHKQGDQFFASEEDARLLKGFGKARDLDDGSSSHEDLSPGQRRRGRYSRADMRAKS